jgi:integrase
LAVVRRGPRTLSGEQIVALLAGCRHLRDRFLVSLLAETGMRVGQALGLRHEDFVSRSKEVRIVPRESNANGARSKLRSVAVIPVSAGLVRLYSEYMYVEYGDCDSDYVFVNLWAGRLGEPLTYAAVHKLVEVLQASPTATCSRPTPLQSRVPHTVRHDRPSGLTRNASSAARSDLPGDVSACWREHR